MTEKSAPHSKGLLASLTTLAATLVAIAYTRLDLLSNDLDEEKAHFLMLLVLILVMLFCLGVGVVLATILVVMAFWEGYRLPVLMAMTAIFLGAGVAVGWLVRVKMKRKARPFAASLAELRTDRAELGSPL